MYLKHRGEVMPENRDLEVFDIQMRAENHTEECSRTERVTRWSHPPGAGRAKPWTQNCSAERLAILL